MFRRKRSRSKRRSRFGRMALWTVVIIETLWLAGFVWSTGSPVPDALRRWAGGAFAAVWNRDRQEELDNQRIEQMLAKDGSKGPTAPPSPKP